MTIPPLLPDLPRTIAGVTSHEIEIKKSRFITTLAHVDAIAEADQLIAATRKKYWDARHNCVAVIIGEDAGQQRSSDDGEPSGTAGVPMLQVLRKRDMTDVVAIVTRYFGGVLLGAGGLIRAYSAAVSQTLDRATVVRRARRLVTAVTCDYTTAGRFENVLRNWCENYDGDLTDVSYDADVTMTVAIDPQLRHEYEAFVATASGGQAHVEFGDLTVVDLPAGC